MTDQVSQVQSLFLRYWAAFKIAEHFASPIQRIWCTCSSPLDLLRCEYILDKGSDVHEPRSVGGLGVLVGLSSLRLCNHVTVQFRRFELTRDRNKQRTVRIGVDFDLLASVVARQFHIV